MANEPAAADLNDVDLDLKESYGAYASYDDTQAAPAQIDYYGETPPHEEINRLLDVYARPDNRVLDVGCGAGFVICRLAAKVREAWGFDQDARLLAAARRRVEVLSLTNVTLVEGNVAVAEDLARLPEARFDLAWSQRGPNLNEGLMRALRPTAMVVQELVNDLDGYPLKDLFGRRVLPPDPHGSVGLIQYYADMGLLPVSVKDYAYDEFYRDTAHLETALRRGRHLQDWRVPESGEYEPVRDRPALDLYVHYHTTDRGIRLTRRQTVFVFRRALAHYYPAVGIPSSGEA
jgi:SAM-dependent methyltransferase